MAIDSILHELLLTEFELAVQRTVESRDDLTLLATERRYYRRERQLRFTQGGRTRRVVPDAGFVVRVGKPSDGTSGNTYLTTMLNFVELDNGTMPPSRVLQKLQQYAAWAASEEGQRYLERSYARYGTSVPQAGFRLLIVVHDKLRPGGDERRLAALFERALTLPAAMRDRLWFATAESLKEFQHDPAPLAGELWYRGRDAKRWLPGVLSSGHEHNTNERRQLVAEGLRLLPRHPLFARSV